MAHHGPLKAFGPIDWADVAQDDLKHFLTTTFHQAQIVVDSIPTPPSQATKPPVQPTRARSRTESAILPPTSPTSPSHPSRSHAATTATTTEAATLAALLQKDWKETKVPPKDNPLAIAVYKLPAKDGHGAWFARRSIHTGVPFAKFRRGLAREFAETMKNATTSGGAVGTGNVRGIGAERCAERAACDGVGSAEVWVLSAQFPGPTTPRDFVTLLLTTGGGDGEEEEEEDGDDDGKRRRDAAEGGPPRQYMVVSKPCAHPECAPRSGFIRGAYESVEIIREVPVVVAAPIRRTRSSVDLKYGEALGTQSLPQSTTELPPQQEAEKTEMAVEWIMVTRSDPGGSVPRFMVEKGTPGSIVNDAVRFLKWLETKDDSFDGPVVDKGGEEEGVDGEPKPALPLRPGQSAADLAVRSKPAQTSTVVDDDIPPSGLYSIITGLVGGAASAVASHLPHISYLSGQDTDPNSLDESDTDSDSDRSFASAPEPAAALNDPTITTTTATKSPNGGGGDLASIHSVKSDGSSTATKTSAAAQHEKQLKKLQDRYRKLEEKTAKQQEKTLQSGKPSHADVDALAKLKEKHDREIARQEENFRKEARKLEEKRAKEERKAEERRKKEAEKEARGNLAMELERTRVERDMALKQIDILKEQVGELQGQNTKLVARLGKLGGLAKQEEILGDGDAVDGA